MQDDSDQMVLFISLEQQELELWQRLMALRDEAFTLQATLRRQHFTSSPALLGHPSLDDHHIPTNPNFFGLLSSSEVAINNSLLTPRAHSRHAHAIHARMCAVQMRMRSGA